MNKYLNNFKTYFRTDKINKVTLRVRYQRFIEKFNKNFYFRIKVISGISLISNFRYLYMEIN